MIRTAWAVSLKTSDDGGGSEGHTYPANKNVSLSLHDLIARAERDGTRA